MNLQKGNLLVHLVSLFRLSVLQHHLAPTAQNLIRKAFNSSMFA